ncbi:MAG: zinc ribbon domain-containing protein [Anaerolineales bacterium]|nr:zinc ribbon domain-containing protein [Anaerolineales bacterium]
MNSGKTIGTILIVAGIAVALLGVIWVATSTLTTAAAVLGIALALIVAAPLVGVGVVMLVRGRHEAQEFARADKQRKLLGMVETQGKVRISDVALELNASREEVQHWIYDLVDKGFFSGYVNWDSGDLYSQSASQLRGNNRCPNCGGELELAGKGVIKCPFCGAEVFLAT